VDVESVAVRNAERVQEILPAVDLAGGVGTVGPPCSRRVASGTLHEGSDRGLVLCAGDESGSPGALLRRGPLRTVHATRAAHGSSKPLVVARRSGGRDSALPALTVG